MSFSDEVFSTDRKALTKKPIFRGQNKAFLRKYLVKCQTIYDKHGKTS
jgi:hypothetical protein